MSAKKSSKRSSSKPAAKKLVDFRKLFADAKKNETTSFVVGENESGTAARHGIGTHDRTDGKSDQSTKARVFMDAYGKLGAANSIDVKALAKRFPAVKQSTIRSWLSNWKRGIAGGAFYPSIASELKLADVEKRFGKLAKK